jgi:O-antigen/teichoic acid export membrane protein
MTPHEETVSSKQKKRGLLGRDYRQLAGTLGQWVVVLLGLVSTNVFSGISLIVLARRVTPLEYGQYTAIFSLAIVTVVLPNLGFTGWILAQPDAAARFGRRFWYATVGPRFLGLIGWALLLWVLCLFLPPETYPVSIAALVLTGVVFDTLLAYGYNFLRVRDQHLIVTAFQTVSGLALLLWVLLGPLGPGQLMNFVLGRMLISLAAIVLLALMIHRRSPADPVAAHETPQRGGLRQTGSYMLAEAASIVYIKADITIVGMHLGAQGVSQYGPASNLLTMTFLVAQALFFFMIPQLARLHKRDRAAFRASARKQFLLQVAGGVAVAIGLYVATPFLVLGLFGEAYAESIPLLQWLSVIPAIRAVTVGLAAVLMAVQRQPERTVVQMTAAVFNVAANLLVIDSFGLMGVVWVFIATEILIALGHIYLISGGRLRRAPLPTEATP